MIVDQAHMKMRSSLSHLLGLILLKMGFVQARLKKIRYSNLITVLYFHNPSAELFSGCIKWLIENNYVFISVRELFDILSNHTLPPVGAVCLTVDDGWRDNLFNIMPVIDNRGIPICFFISTEPVENGLFWWSICAHAKREGSENNISIKKLKTIAQSERTRIVDDIRKKTHLYREAMTKEEVAELSKNIFVTIGSHTVNHACLNQCTKEELVHELRESRRLLSEWTQKEITCFAYPNGDFKGTERKVLEESGYLLAFATKEEFISPGSHDLFYIPRLGINDHGSLEENICKITGLWQTLKKSLFQFEKYKTKKILIEL